MFAEGRGWGIVYRWSGWQLGSVEAQVMIWHGTTLRRGERSKAQHSMAWHSLALREELNHGIIARRGNRNFQSDSRSNIPNRGGIERQPNKSHTTTWAILSVPITRRAPETQRWWVSQTQTKQPQTDGTHSPKPQSNPIPALPSLPSPLLSGVSKRASKTIEPRRDTKRGEGASRTKADQTKQHSSRSPLSCAHLHRRGHR